MLYMKNKMGIRKESRTFNIPITTILDRISGRVPDHLRKPGPPPLLTVEGKKRVKEWVINTAKCGFPVNKETLFNTVSKIAKDSGKVSCEDGIPHQSWYTNFLKRNPEISLIAGLPTTPIGVFRNHSGTPITTIGVLVSLEIYTLVLSRCYREKVVFRVASVVELLFKVYFSWLRLCL